MHLTSSDTVDMKEIRLHFRLRENKCINRCAHRFMHKLQACADMIRSHSK